MQIDVHTSLGSHKHDVRNAKDVLDLIGKIMNQYCIEDNDWKG